MNNISIRECTFDDELQVLELWKRNRLITENPKKNWKMLWLKNPTYNKDWPIGWVLELNKKIVGSLINIPMTYYLENKKIITAIPGGFVVDIEARNLSIKLVSHFFNQTNIDLFLGTTANKSSAAVIKLFDCQNLPSSTYNTQFHWIINIGDVIKYELYKRLGISNFLINFLTFLLTPLCSILLKILGHGLKNNNVNWHGKIEIIPIKDINVDFDKLWQRKKSELPKILLADRSAETLRWHFSKFDKYSHRTKILTARLDGELLGYLIVDIEDLPRSSSKRLRINDFFVSQNSIEIIDALIYKAFIFAKKNNLHSIVVVGFNPIIRKRFMILKPFKRKLDYMPFMFKTLNSNLLSKLLKKDTWYPGPYDGDTSL